MSVKVVLTREAASIRLAAKYIAEAKRIRDMDIQESLAIPDPVNAPPKLVGLLEWCGDKLVPALASPDAFYGVDRSQPDPTLPYCSVDMAREQAIAVNTACIDRDKRKPLNATPYFHPVSLSAFVQDARVIRKGPWK